MVVAWLSDEIGGASSVGRPVFIFFAFFQPITSKPEHNSCAQKEPGEQRVCVIVLQKNGRKESNFIMKE